MDGIKARPLPPNLLLEERVFDLSAGLGRLAEPEIVQGGGQEEGEEDEEDGTAGAAAAPTVALAPEYRRSWACPNPEEPNSAAMVTFQVRAWVGC